MSRIIEIQKIRLTDRTMKKKNYKLKVYINGELGVEYFTTHQAAANYFNKNYKNYKGARFGGIINTESTENPSQYM